jgi:rhodanese-related sulfurtransferase
VEAFHVFLNFHPTSNLNRYQSARCGQGGFEPVFSTVGRFAVLCHVNANRIVKLIKKISNQRQPKAKTMKKFLVLCAAVFATVAVYASQFPDIKVEELQSAIAAKKVTVIDVNGTESWKAGHIPGAIDFKANADKLEQVLPKDKNALVVAYCGGPTCGAYQAAAKAAKKLGYTNVKHLSAGISGWKKAGAKTDVGT